MAYLPRSNWTSESGQAPQISETITGIYIHYPESVPDIGEMSEAQSGNTFSSILDDHLAGGYNDIAYNMGVDQNGRIWELRGIDRQSGSQGTTEANQTGQSIVVLVGNTEEPTTAALDAVNECIALIQDEHPSVETLAGHRDVVGTDCPGEHLYGAIQDGTLSLDGDSVPDPDPDPEPDPDPDPDPEPEPDPLEVDGRAGVLTISELQRRLGVTVDGRAAEQTWRALQTAMGTPVDGVVSNQSYRAEELGNGIVPRAWLFTGRGSSGSTMVRAMQGQLGVGTDGIWFEATTRALQQRLNNDANWPSASAPARVLPRPEGVTDALACANT